MNTIKTNQTFEQIKHTDENGVEFWLARELQVVLQYKEWRNFSKVIDTAKIACKISQHEVSEHFVEVNKVLIVGNGARQKIKDYELVRGGLKEGQNQRFITMPVFRKTHQSPNAPQNEIDLG